MSHEPATARDMILSAAVQVLRDEGPAKLTQTRVAKAAGLRQGHLTYYFPKKSDLWVATAARAHDEMESQLADLFASTGSATTTDEIRARMVTVLTEVVTNNQRTRMMLSLALQSQEDPELLELCRENIERTRNLLRATLGEHFPAEVVELTMATLWGLGMRELGVVMGVNDCATLNLVGKLFEMLGRLPLESSIRQS